MTRTNAHQSYRDILNALMIINSESPFQLPYIGDPNESLAETNDITRDSFAIVWFQSKDSVDSDNLVNQTLTDKIQASINYLNRSRGNKLNETRRRKEKHNRRISGGGFSYKPEIGYSQGGPIKVNPIFYDSQEGSSLLEESILIDDLHEDELRAKYERRNHEPQSTPKIEWEVERRWRNKRKPRPLHIRGHPQKNIKGGKTYNTTARGIQDQEDQDSAREYLSNNPRVNRVYRRRYESHKHQR